MSRRMRANSGDARSSSVPSGRILLRKARRKSVKSTMPVEICATAFHSSVMAEGGFSAISRHSAARPTTTAEFPNLGGEPMLRFDPVAIRRSNEQRDLSLSKRGRCIASKQIAERFELQHACAGVGKRGRHRSSCYRENGDGSQRAAPRIPMKEQAAHAFAARETLI